MLRTCVREGGIYAPVQLHHGSTRLTTPESGSFPHSSPVQVAALGWLAFHIDSKTFLGEGDGPRS